jgi:hypothetical protein
VIPYLVIVAFFVYCGWLIWKTPQERDMGLRRTDNRFDPQDRRSVPCSHCGATAGQSCATEDGRVLMRGSHEVVHQARKDAHKALRAS